MKRGFQETVKDYFDFLFEEYGFSVLEVDEEGQPFGNALVTVESKGVVIRFTKDRDDYIVWITSSAAEDEREWWNEDLIASLIGVCDGTMGLDDFSDSSKFLQDQIEEIMKMFSPSSYKVTRKRLMALSEQRLLARQRRANSG